MDKKWGIFKVLVITKNVFIFFEERKITYLIVSSMIYFRSIKLPDETFRQSKYPKSVWDWYHSIIIYMLIVNKVKTSNTQECAQKNLIKNHFWMMILKFQIKSLNLTGWGGGVINSITPSKSAPDSISKVVEISFIRLRSPSAKHVFRFGPCVLNYLWSTRTGCTGRRRSGPSLRRQSTDPFHQATGCGRRHCRTRAVNTVRHVRETFSARRRVTGRWSGRYDIVDFARRQTERTTLTRVSIEAADDGGFQREHSIYVGRGLRVIIIAADEWPRTCTTSVLSHESW